MTDFLNEFFQEKNAEEVVLATLFVIYLVMGYPLPYQVKTFLNTILGKLVVCSISLILFVVANPIVSVLGFLVAFDLIAKTETTSTYIDKQKLYETNQNIVEKQNNSLEHAVVEKMAPIPFSDTPISDVVNPLLGPQHDASLI